MTLDSPLARTDLEKQNESPSKALSKSEGEVPIATNPMDLIQGDESSRRREASLRQHSFFQLRINLISGSDLVAMDKSGKYVFLIIKYKYW